MVGFKLYFEDGSYLTCQWVSCGNGKKRKDILDLEVLGMKLSKWGAIGMGKSGGDSDLAGVEIKI